MRTIINWCDNSDLQIAREETEILLLTRMRVPRIFNLTLAGKTLITRERVIYLGVVLNTKRNFYDHIEVVRARADAVVGAIRGLLPNVNRPSNACRKLYYQVWKSVVLYTSPVWLDALSKTKVVKELCKAQRSALTSTSTPYRTVSHAALCVLTGTMPVHIRARWRGRVFEVEKLVRPDLQNPEVIFDQLKLHEEEALEEWRREWSKYNTNNWTRRLIDDAATFRKRKRSIDHFTMQMLTGHGIFNNYRVRINKETDDKCWDCDASPVDAEHVLLRCPRWAIQRTTLENMMGDIFTAHNIIALVWTNDHIWGQFRVFCTIVMKSRQA